MIVVDTSVVFKWFVTEDGSERAAELIGSAMIAPDLIVAELANALWKKCRRGEIAVAQGRAALAELPDLVTLFPSPPLADPAFAIASHFGHPVYDCFFLALAEHSDVPLVTADARLIGKLAGSDFAARATAFDDYRP